MLSQLHSVQYVSHMQHARQGSPIMQEVVVTQPWPTLMPTILRCEQSLGMIMDNLDICTQINGIVSKIMRTQLDAFRYIADVCKLC
jgi:hypothetical protein